MRKEEMKEEEEGRKERYLYQGDLKRTRIIVWKVGLL